MRVMPRGTSVRPSTLWVNAAAEPDCRLRGARAQPEGRHARHAEGRARGHHGPLGLGQVVACVRHDLRRGAAALCRVAERVRAPVPGPDGQARRGFNRGVVAGDLDRPEDDVAQPAVHGRHRHRDLRLPAPAVGTHRPSALPHLRQADRRAVDRAGHRPGDGAGGGHALHGARADRARAQGRVRQGLRRAARRGLRAREGRRRAADARGRDRARQEVQARHLGGRRPARDAHGRAQAPGRLDRDGGRAGGRHGRDRNGAARRQGHDHALLREVRLP
jgi:hypothetical protein